MLFAFKGGVLNRKDDVSLCMAFRSRSGHGVRALTGRDP